MRFKNARLISIRREMGKAYKEFEYNPYTAIMALDSAMHDGVISIHIQEDGTYKYQFFPKSNIDRETILEQNLLGHIEVGGKIYLITSKQAETLLNNDIFTIDSNTPMGTNTITYTDSDGIHTEEVEVFMRLYIKLCIIVGDNVILIETTKKKESYNSRGIKVASSDSKKSMSNIPLKDFTLRNL